MWYTHSKYAVTQVMRLVLLTLPMLLTLALLATACQTASDEGASPTATLLSQHAPATAEAMQTSLCRNNATFVVTVDGSELIAPVTERIAEKFMIQNSCVRVVIDGNGTGQGFERFCNGEIHINEAYLWVRNTDRELCSQNSIEWLELPIMWDSFANFVSTRNDFVECLTAEQNRQIWSSTSTVRVWSEIVSHWPNKETRRYAALNTRGSPIFVDSPSYNDAEHLDHFDLAMVDSLAADPFGIGLFSTAYYAGNEDRIRSVSIDAGEGCISTNPLAVEPGQRPVWGHAIYIYVNRQALRDHQILQGFLDFYMTEASTVTREMGFFALSPEEYEENRNLIRASAVAP